MKRSEFDHKQASEAFHELMKKALDNMTERKRLEFAGDVLYDLNQLYFYFDDQVRGAK